MSRAEVHIVSIQLSRSASEKSNNARYKSDSVVTSEVQAAIAHPGITDEYVKQRKTYCMDNVDAHFVSVDIPDSTCTCSKPSSCTCYSRKHQAQKQRATDYDFSPTINSDNDNIRCQKADRAFLFDFQGSRHMSENIAVSLIPIVVIIYYFGLFMTLDETAVHSVPIDLLLLVTFVSNIGQSALYILYIDDNSSESTNSTLHDSNNHYKSCRGNESDVPTNDTVHIVNDDTDQSPISYIEPCLDLRAVLCLNLAHMLLMVPTTITVFFTVVVFGLSYPEHKNVFVFAVFVFTLLLRTLVYIQMYHKTGRESDCRFRPQACYRGSFIFYMIPGMIFTVVGLLFKETKAMFPCGCISIGLAFMFGNKGFKTQHACAVIFMYVLAMYIVTVNETSFVLIMWIAGQGVTVVSVLILKGILTHVD